MTAPAQTLTLFSDPPPAAPRPEEERLPRRRRKKRAAAVPFVRSSEASREAAEAQEPATVEGQEAGVLAYLRERETPATDPEIFAGVKQLTGHEWQDSSIRRARVALVRKGLVELRDKKGVGAPKPGGDGFLSVSRWGLVAR